jgi:GDP/UDP-N,N'-diacetylbacillosamine 2-epimerase (hydrolysing)
MENSSLLDETRGKVKIIALTGIRSEYDLIFPLLKELQNDSAFELGVICCGAHLTPLHNFSVKQIEEDGFTIVEKMENLLYSNSLAGKVKSAGILLTSLAETLAREKPNLLIVIGDREEPIIGAIAGNYLNIPVLHVSGGDNTFPIDGDVDEQVRHATTKLSHIHLTMAAEHSQRIIKMGEEPWRVFTVGSGGIDRLRTEQGITLDQLARLAGDSVKDPYVILIYHALSSEIMQARQELDNCIRACLDNNVHVYVGAPNSDPGFQDILNVIKTFENHPLIHPYNNLPRQAFITLLRNAKGLVGNSSLAFHEAEYIGLPAVNIGERQRGRLSGNNVQFVDGTYDSIFDAVKKALHDTSYRASLKAGSSVYGDGHMAQKSLQVIKKLPDTRTLLAKKITY